MCTLPEAEILTRLVRLNHECASEEQQGHVRYLRPTYQAPSEQQATMAMATTPVFTAATIATAQPWSAELAQQMFAVRSIVQQAGGEALSSAQVAACFRRIKADTVKPFLDTLAMMSLVRYLELEDTYAA